MAKNTPNMSLGYVQTHVYMSMNVAYESVISEFFRHYNFYFIYFSLNFDPK